MKINSHLSLLRQTWKLLDSHTQGQDDVKLDGESLTLAAVVAVSRRSAKASLSQAENLVRRLEDSVNTLNATIERGEQVYGVNTGCGTNANTRTQKLETLQHSFFQHHQAGILPGLASSHGNPLLDMGESGQSLSPEAVRGTILLRCNSLLRGHSAVKIEIIDLLLRVLNEGYVPLIPLRGSISASGDLSPLSYIGGLIFVQFKENNTYKTISAAEVLQRLGVEPTLLNAKEGLGVMNGTAVSAAVASLSLYDSHNLALLTQVLTGMATEALLGTVDNYHEFISQCRPHPGQMEVARNIRTFLHGSHFCQETDVNQAGLVQDRYALRTAPQWIGPQLEDLLSAARQIDVELNSTTDNPLIDPEDGRFHHGGNFQAMSVTSATEKCRSSLVLLGRILLGQCGELTNPTLSKGLPANLALDDPSLSFAAKGLDVNMTAYYSELAYLGNSVSGHVQSAEMGNQTVNSLALISARYTGECVQVLSMMCAVHLYILCQALDIRALTKDFFTEAKKEVKAGYHRVFGESQQPVAADFEAVWTQITSTWLETGHMDLSDRCNQVAVHSNAYILDAVTQGPTPPPSSFCSSTKQWKGWLSSALANRYDQIRQDYIKSPSTPTYLGAGSKAMYEFVRRDLGVPLHQGIIDHPPLANDTGISGTKRTIGSYVSQVYVAIRQARFVESIRQVVDAEGSLV